MRIFTDFSSVIPREGRTPLRNVQETRIQALGCLELRGIHIAERPAPTTHSCPLHFSRDTYNALLQAHGPVPNEVVVPSDDNMYSFTVLAGRDFYPLNVIIEASGQLSGITIDVDGMTIILSKNNFCRIPGCGYWAKDAVRMPRHRITHFNDRGLKYQNPYREGTSAPTGHLQCRLNPGHYFKRLDHLKKHIDTSNGCQLYPLGTVPEI